MSVRLWASFQNSSPGLGQIRRTGSGLRALQTAGRPFYPKEGCPLSAVKWVLSTMRKNRTRVILGMVLNLICVGFNVVGPMIYASIIDDVIKGGQTQKLAPLCYAALVVAVAFSICTYLSQYCLESASQNTERDLRQPSSMPSSRSSIRASTAAIVPAT